MSKEEVDMWIVPHGEAAITADDYVRLPAEQYRALLKERNELRAELAALREAAGKVMCWKCWGYGFIGGSDDGSGLPCPDCADLRRLPADQPPAVTSREP